MLSCVKPKVLAYLSNAVKEDRLAITDDLAVVKSRDMPEESSDEYYPPQYNAVDPARKELLRSLMLEKLDAYLSSHQLEAKLPEAIAGSIQHCAQSFGRQYAEELDCTSVGLFKRSR